MTSVFLVALLFVTHVLPDPLANLGVGSFAALAYVSDGLERGALWALVAGMCWHQGLRYRWAAVAAGAAGLFGSLLYGCILLIPAGKAIASDVGVCTQAGIPMAWSAPLLAFMVAAVLSTQIERQRARNLERKVP